MSLSHIKPHPMSMTGACADHPLGYPGCCSYHEGWSDALDVAEQHLGVSRGEQRAVEPQYEQVAWGCVIEGHMAVSSIRAAKPTHAGAEFYEPVYRRRGPVPGDADLRTENEKLREALRKVEYLGSQAQTNAAVHMGLIARAALRSEEREH